jgi:hypothetical protein
MIETEDNWKMKRTSIGWTPAALTLLLALLVGCGTAPAQPESTHFASEPSAEHRNAEVLDRDGQLALGTLRLEDSENAVTVEQASALLPLWQAIRSGSLQSEAETEAVLDQIEGQMTSQQLAAIQAMRLSPDDLLSWAQTQGVNLDAGQGLRAMGAGGELPPEVQERLLEQSGGEMPSPEQLAEMRAQRENMSDEERQAMRDSAEASGRAFGGAGPGLGQWAAVLNPLIELLGERAAA